MATIDLLEYIDLPSTEGLNVALGKGVDNCLTREKRDEAGLHTESDVDEELLVILRFRVLVKVSSLSISGPAGSAPAALKLFCNPLSLDISTAASDKPTQEIALSPAQVAPGAPPVPLRFVLFQKVSALGLFFPSAQDGGEKTALSRLAVHGTVVPNEGAAWAKDVEKSG